MIEETELTDAEAASSSATMVTIEHMFELWIEPELQRRGLTTETFSLRKALVVMKRDQTPVVQLNGEFELMATVRSTRAIAEGEAITASDFDEIHALQPAGIDEDAGWIAFIALPDGRPYLAFDFRYELGRSRGGLTRADEFLASARDDLAAGRTGPAIDGALAAGELAVMVQMRTVQADVDNTRRHGSRCTWLTEWTRLGNARPEYAAAMRRLAQLRAWARYADDTALAPRDGEVTRLFAEVEALIEDTRTLIATRPVEP